jgi:ApaG protein
MSNTLTRGVRILARPQYIADRSETGSSYFFAYQIRIRNEGDATVKLLGRHWVITDGNGRVEEVRGPGVVGYQPVLAPGEAFEYTSACPLPTPVGTMHGEFHMLFTHSEELFDAQIEPFRLSVPGMLN